MKRFAKGVMWFVQHMFGLEELYLLYEPDGKEGDYILNQIMVGGNSVTMMKGRKLIRVKGSLGQLPRY